MDSVGVEGDPGGQCGGRGVGIGSHWFGCFSLYSITTF